MRSGPPAAEVLLVALAYLVDENLRGVLVAALLRTAAKYGLTIDVVQVGDQDAPVRGTTDPELIRWAEDVNRIIVTNDRQTFIVHLGDHLAEGGGSPGVMIALPVTLAALADFLVIAAVATEPEEWAGRATFVP
jgi:hypothetical protein